MTPIPYTDADVAYVMRDFVSLEDLCHKQGADLATVREHIEQGQLPRPTYVLPDGCEMVPDTYFALAEEAGGIPRLRAEFARRADVAAAAEGVELDVDDEWEAYLSGEYGVCLREVSPEAIMRKAALMGRIEELLEARGNADPHWASALRDAVDELDALERPFAPDYDRLRFGGPSSRDRLITATRERFPTVFETSVSAAAV